MLCLKITKLRQIAWSEKLKNQKNENENENQDYNDNDNENPFCKNAIKGTVFDGTWLISLDISVVV